MFSPKEIKDVAQQALNYARSYIIKSSTELSINQYELSRRLSISQGVAEVRLLMKELTSSVVELNYNIIFFYNSIELSKKYSLGNCRELSFLALDYIVHHLMRPISAEVFHIKGGDHMFLVIGRSLATDSTDPATWNEETYICDPWSNQVYPAQRYLTMLKNHYIDGEKHCLENFNPLHHRLEATQFSTYLLKDITVDIYKQHMLLVYERKSLLMLQALLTLKIGLLEFKEKIFKNTTAPDALALINFFILKLDNAYILINSRLTVNDDESSYTLRKRLEALLTSDVYAIKQCLAISEVGNKATLHFWKIKKNFKQEIFDFISNKEQNILSGMT